ncbi:MAG: threonine synthase [Bdellovibrionales bacterium]|nr:threonine synthase [Bdellovibrionales bacterium]
MKYISTRSSEHLEFISTCILKGLAPDGGLFVPSEVKPFDLKNYHSEMSFHEFSYQFLKVFFQGDELESHLPGICERAFNFEIPLANIHEELELLELYHGPTNAFKDFGARFLAECLEVINKSSASHKAQLVLVATSGDTGGAVASAFFQRKNCQVGLLFPQGGVSDRQKSQLTGWGKNILSFEVKGVFDDCQRMVKEAFKNQEINKKYELTSANSINIARLLPQAAYFAYAGFQYFVKYNKNPSFYVPTGNMGNVFGAFLAKACGFPVQNIVIATNANETIVDFYKTHQYKPRPSIKTLANAMDVGAPSNLERLMWLHPSQDELLRVSKAVLVSDENIKNTIKETFKKFNKVICPHTATAMFAWRHFQDESNGAIVVATAHPAKFNEIVEPLIEMELEVPENLKNFLARKPDHKIVEAELTQLLKYLMI